LASTDLARGQSDLSGDFALQQLLFVEAVLKLAGGIVLAVLPLTASHVLGLPKPDSGLWPRLLGAVLIGTAIGCYVEARVEGTRGVTLVGLAAINLSAAAMLAVLLSAQRASATARGRAVLWLLMIALLALAGLELVNA
jgi:hypothetical protein